MRILIVEDEAKVAQLIADGLRAEGFAVEMARDGLAGLEKAAEIHYDLLIIDLMLPRLSGTDLLHRLRAKKIATPVLILTARTALEDKVANFEAGADDYLTKPFAFAELLVRVRALLRRQQPTTRETMAIAGLKIDRLTRRVERDGIAIRLTSKEYALLEYLAGHAGRALSRAMIMEQVWGQSFEGLTNIVDVYVRQLRLKIDDPFALKLIHTARGVGYYLNDTPEA